MNKKIISAVTASISLAIVASVGLSVCALSKTNNNNDKNKDKPLNRGDNYEHINVSSHFDKSKIKDWLVVFNNKDKSKPILSKEKFKYDIESLTRFALSKIDRFKNHADEYKIIVTYQFTNDCCIAIDLVWYIPNTDPFYYYDQFQISLRGN